ncbi:unnamed protein product [Durusdinium trenchii]|uniref:Zeta toxin domain-containing protein n=1 Tax=Durusdinium trenchii TaxID=1381693 RepID=A0ABP0QWL2_9DINO
MQMLLFRHGFLALLLLDLCVAWVGPKLEGPAGEQLMEWIQHQRSSQLFCQLMRQRHSCTLTETGGVYCEERGECLKNCAACTQEKVEELLEKAKKDIAKLKETASGPKPLAVFVLGAVASGKSSFIKKKLSQELKVADFAASAVHVNADELRGAVLGSYEVYAAVSSNAEMDLGPVNQAAQQLRREIQELVRRERVNYLADSITMPWKVAETFQESFTIQIFYLSLPGVTNEAKAEEGQKRLDARVQQGGHKSRCYPEQIRRSQASAEALEKENMKVSWLESRDGDFFQGAPLRSPCTDIWWPSGLSPLDREREAIGFLKRIFLNDGSSQPVELPTPDLQGVLRLDPGFSVTVDSQRGFVKHIAMKKKTDTNITYLNCALHHFPNLLRLILDGSELSGRLAELELPRQTERLHLRYCPQVAVQLQDLKRFQQLKVVKLEGSNVSGSLEALNFTHLTYVDLRGHVKGNLSNLAFSSNLIGFWAQFTKVSGDINALVRNNLKLEYLDLRESQISGSINDEWKESGQSLKELRLSGSQVNFQMSDPPVGDKKPQMAFPKLTILDLSRCPLNMDVWKLLLPLSYNHQLVWMVARKTGLWGEVKDMKQWQNFPLQFHFKILDLAYNRIENLSGDPLSGCTYKLRGNPLKEINPKYFQWPSGLDLRDSNFTYDKIDKDFDTFLQVDQNSMTAVDKNLVEGWECRGVQPRSGKSGCKLWVTGETFAPERLCRCSAGWAGQGTVCDECVRPLEPDAGSRCCLCPPNQRLARPESQPDGAHQCYRCHGKGCLHQNCENRNDCSKGYKGTLCSYCADDYYWSAGICKECHVKRSQASWAPLIVLKYLGLALLVASLTFVVVHFAARKGDPKSKFDQGLRSAELMEQALLLLTFLQLMKTVNSVNAIDHLNGEDEGEDTDHVGSALWKVIQLRIGDVLDYCFRPECDLGYIAGHQLERLSSAFLLPFLCVLVLSAGACRGSPFYALRFCIIVVSALFPGTIEVTLSNLICIDADEGKLPLEEMSFLRGMPFVKCDDWSEYHYLQVTMRLAVLVNAVFLPGALLALGWSINRQVAPFWSSCSWQKPSFGLDASFEAITLRFDASGVKREGRESLGAALSPLLWTETSYLRICMASHLACLAEAVASAEPLQVEMMAPEDGKESMTFTCSATDQWRRLTVQQQEHCLRDARSYAIGLSETFLYRHVARAALMEGNLESLWLGARNTFERFSVSDPLLFVGLSQVAVAAITALCVKKDLATLGTTFLLLAIGLFRGKPFGSRSRNQLGFICYLSLAAFSFVLYLFGKGRHTWAIFLIVPLGFFLHLQMMQGDVMLQAYKLLEDLPNTEQRAWTRSARLFHVTPVVWHSETTKSWVRRLFETYRHHARTLTVKGGGLLLRLEDLLLRGLRRLLSARSRSAQRRVRRSRQPRRDPRESGVELGPVPAHW